MTRVSRHIRAPRELVYRVLLDALAVQNWMVPDQMTSLVHSFHVFEGGTFRISLTYDLPTTAGKTDARTDSFHGRFAKLVPDTEVVELVEFETDDPQMQGEMTITFTLADSEGGNLVTGLHENLPPGVPTADNKLGWRMSLDKLPPSSRADSWPLRSTLEPGGTPTRPSSSFRMFHHGRPIATRS
jgi:uncharacterized protein YndB with AHSA1/START domain